MKLRDNGMIKEDEDVIVILTAHGSKFSNAAIDYHQDYSNQYANTTITIQPDINKLERAVNI